jgi:hypothetical protein
MLGGPLILFGLSHTLWLSLTMMVFGLMQCASASNTKREGLPERKDALVSAWGRILVDTDPSMLRVNKSVCATQT